MNAPGGRASEAGFSLVALFAAVTIMMILMAVAMPSWKYVVQNEREQELFFRGNQIALAIERYQKKNGNAPAPSLEVLVKGKYLRKEYADPMTKDGKWRFLRPGEVVAPRLSGGLGGATRGARTNLPGRPATGITMPFVGVASFSEEASLRVMNGAETYDEWWFVAGKPRVLGRPQVPTPGMGPSGQPGGAPPVGSTGKK